MACKCVLEPSRVLYTGFMLFSFLTGHYIWDLRKEWWAFLFVILSEQEKRKRWWLLTDKRNGLGGTRWEQSKSYSNHKEKRPEVNILLVCCICVQNGSHLWQLALQKRKEGRCPLEPGEVAVILRAMGYPKETQIYVASGQVYGGKNRMAPLRNMFPNLVSSLFTRFQNI